MDNFFQFLWALVTFQWIRDIREITSSENPESVSLLRLSRYCGNCGDLVYLTADTTWTHSTLVNHEPAPLLLSDNGEPSDPDLTDDDFWETE